MYHNSTQTQAPTCLSFVISAKYKVPSIVEKHLQHSERNADAHICASVTRSAHTAPCLELRTREGGRAGQDVLQELQLALLPRPRFDPQNRCTGSVGNRWHGCTHAGDEDVRRVLLPVSQEVRGRAYEEPTMYAGDRGRCMFARVLHLRLFSDEARGECWEF
jgi:hypothetical protein